MLWSDQKRHIKGEKYITPVDFAEHLRKSDVSENSTVETKICYYNILKYTFSVPPGSKNNWVYLMSHKFRRDFHVNFKHNTKHITDVLFSILLTEILIC